MRVLSIFDLMLPAFCECLVLVGIHSYLGLHVIRRKVIFVDLALAQVAALGTTVGFLFGMAPDSVAAFIFSVLFTFMAAAVFSVARLRNDRVPQEAIIGLVYAIAAAVVILVIDRAPHGAEHIKEVMTGSILWVKWESIIFAAVVYSAIGLLHWRLADRFLLISRDPEEAYRRGMRVRLWDFLFYMTFGVVIAISVRTAGVLLVFVFLVVPAITATLITDRLRWQLVIGWSMGLLVTVLGLGLSYWADMPSGPTVVSFYGLMLVVAAVGLYLFRHPTTRALRHVLAGLGVVGVAGLVIVLGGTALGRSPLAVSRSHGHGDDVESSAGDHQDAGTLDDARGGHRARGSLDAQGFLRALSAADSQEQRRIVDSMGAAGYPVMKEAFEASDDGDVQLTIARNVARAHGPAKGGALLVRVLREVDFPFVRSEAAVEIERLAGRRFAYDPEQSVEANRDTLEAMDRWVATAGN